MEGRKKLKWSDIYFIAHKRGHEDTFGHGIRKKRFFTIEIDSNNKIIEFEVFTKIAVVPKL